MLTTANVDVKGVRGFKIHEPKGSTPNVTNPLQNIDQNASINSSTAKPMICNKIENFKFVRTVSTRKINTYLIDIYTLIFFYKLGLELD